MVVDRLLDEQLLADDRDDRARCRLGRDPSRKPAAAAADLEHACGGEVGRPAEGRQRSSLRIEHTRHPDDSAAV